MIVANPFPTIGSSHWANMFAAYRRQGAIEGQAMLIQIRGALRREELSPSPGNLGKEAGQLPGAGAPPAVWPATNYSPMSANKTAPAQPGNETPRMLSVADTAPSNFSQVLCADCGKPVDDFSGPPGGWLLEDGRTVCHPCCVADTRRFFQSQTLPLHGGDPSGAQVIR